MWPELALSAASVQGAPGAADGFGGDTGTSSSYSG
jgi:hypothetical protein